MKLLDLFSGLEGWSGPWQARGHEALTLDLDPRFGAHFQADIIGWDPAELPWRPDVILASPPCEKFSVLTIGQNWTGPRDLPPHQPKTEGARLALRIVERTLELIRELEPAFWLIENPTAKLRKLSVMGGLERRSVTYCSLGEIFRKPTDLWGGFPPSLELPPMCRVTAEGVEFEDWLWNIDGRTGRRCHIKAPRGSRTGTQGPLEALRHPPSEEELEEAELLRRRTRGGNLSQHKRQHRQILDGQPREGPRRRISKEERADLAALRAKIPERLSLLVLEAAEADLAAGRRAPLPGADSLFGEIW